MIKKKTSTFSFFISLLITIFFHLVVIFLFKKNHINSIIFDNFGRTRSLKIDRIELIKSNELNQIKKVGIKNGEKKDFFQPDSLKIPKFTPPSPLSLGNLAPNLFDSNSKNSNNRIIESKNDYTAVQKNYIPPDNNSSKPFEDRSNGHIFFNPKKEKKISRNQEQDNLKQETFKSIPSNPKNPVSQKLSNFEIRYERPEGVSEDELNSDEKAYYSFFKRSYANYLTKLYATYEKVNIERPGLEKDLNDKHLLIGKIDYDENGNIVLVKILKSSESDNVHYFFEETLKQLNLPNPPKSFIKNRKQFTTYYQIQIN